MYQLLLITYIIGAFIVASLLMAWFHSALPLHVLYFLKRIKLLKLEDENIWQLCPEFIAGEIEWQDMLIMGVRPTWFNNMTVDLVTCKICLSFHLSFWVSLVSSLTFYYTLIAEPTVFLLIPAATFSYPIISNLILNYGIPTDKAR